MDRLEKKKMPSLNELPAKCIECAKSKVSHPHRNCRFCNELEFEESDGELSIDEIVHKIKRFSNNAILDKFPLIKDKLSGNIEIWDDTYFVETIG